MLIAGGANAKHRYSLCLRPILMTHRATFTGPTGFLCFSVPYVQFIDIVSSFCSLFCDMRPPYWVTLWEVWRMQVTVGCRSTLEMARSTSSNNSALLSTVAVCKWWFSWHNLYYVTPPLHQPHILSFHGCKTERKATSNCLDLKNQTVTQTKQAETRLGALVPNTFIHSFILNNDSCMWRKKEKL